MKRGSRGLDLVLVLAVAAVTAALMHRHDVPPLAGPPPPPRLAVPEGHVRGLAGELLQIPRQVLEVQRTVVNWPRWPSREETHVSYEEAPYPEAPARHRVKATVYIPRRPVR